MTGSEFLGFGKKLQSTSDRKLPPGRSVILLGPETSRKERAHENGVVGVGFGDVCWLRARRAWIDDQRKFDTGRTWIHDRRRPPLAVGRHRGERARERRR